MLARPRLSLCMIVKNEVDCLPACLDSVKDIVDEMVIVDTGSTDGTLDLVKKWASKMTQVAWNDDFSHARNISIAMATGDWILSMDADSCLEKTGRGALLEAIKNPDTLACQLVMRNHYEGGECETFLCTPLFRRLPAVRYTGKVHEQVTPALREIMTTAPKWRCETLPNVIIEHYGYLHQQTKLKKRSRNILLLTQALEEEPCDIYRRFKLAQALGAETDLGFKHLKAALEALLKLPPGQIQQQAFAHELLGNAALRLAGRNEPTKALEICSLAESLFARHPVTSFVKALSYYLVRDTGSALLCANMALQTAWPPGSFVCNPKWLREDLYLLIATIRQQRGEDCLAVHILRKAVLEFPDSRRLVYALVQSGLAAKMPREVLDEAARWLQSYGPDAQWRLLCAKAANMCADPEAAAKWRSLAQEPLEK
ncbi:MAG: tetratricopeptide repeat-containing glycosyltransferase family 2 protein [Syntrophobacteraceae bacterium]